MNHAKKSTPAEFFDELHQMAEQHLQLAIASYQNLSEDVLNKSSNNKWSIAQCLEHLNTYHRHYLPLITEALANQPENSVAIIKRGWLGDYFIKMMDADRKAVQYKATKAHLPAAALDAYEVVAEFINHQEKLMQLLKRATAFDLNSIRVSTSLSSLIRLRLGDTIAFLIVHDERHIRQANRNINHTL